MKRYPDIKEFFDENGYYMARGVYSPQAVRELEADFDRIVATNAALKENSNRGWVGENKVLQSSPNLVLNHTHQVQSYSARWLQAMIDPVFLDAAEGILGPDIVLHHSKLLQKPAEKGAVFPMHQDWTYFPSELDTMIGATIAVTRATDEMGCLRVYPGSHRIGRVAGTDGQSHSDFMEKNYPLERATIVEAEAGDVLFFHYFTVHGSMPNRSKETRKNVLVQLLSGHDRIEPANHHTNSRLVLRGWNYCASRSYAEAPQ